MAIPRLLKRADFVRLTRQGKSWATRSLVIQKAAQCPALEVPSSVPPLRVGFTATRRVGNATVRNRAKRRLREIAEKLLPTLGASGHDYVLIARYSTATCSFETLLKDATWALKKLEDKD